MTLEVVSTCVECNAPIYGPSQVEDTDNLIVKSTCAHVSNYPVEVTV